LVMLGETILPPAVLSAISDYTNDDEDTHELAASDDGVTAGKLLEPQSHDTPQLSTREKFVLKCLTEGNSNKTIARRINIADATVKVHVKAILRKIRVHNRTQAAIWAMNNDLSVATASDGPSAPAKPADHLPVNARARIGSSRNGGPAFLPVKVDHLK